MVMIRPVMEMAGGRMRRATREVCGENKNEEDFRGGVRPHARKRVMMVMVMVVVVMVMVKRVGRNSTLVASGKMTARHPTEVKMRMRRMRRTRTRRMMMRRIRRMSPCGTDRGPRT